MTKTHLKKILFGFVLLNCFISHSQVWHQTAKLVAMDATEDDWFGNAVAIADSIAVIGAHYDDEKGTGAGSVYVFKKTDSSWVQVQKLTASDSKPNDNFGWSVAIYGETLVVGAKKHNQTGAVYIFQFQNNSWKEVQKITASDGEYGDNFGHKVACERNRIFVSADLDDLTSKDEGSVYVFNNVNNIWAESAKLIATSGHSGDHFGSSISIFEEQIIIGADQGKVNETNSGSAYVFSFLDGQWVETATLVSKNLQNHDQFGASVHLDSNIAVIGAIGDNFEGKASGAVYIFKKSKNGWEEFQKLTPSDPATYDYFGNSLSFFNNHVLVGAFRDDDGGNDTGSVYYFSIENGQWIEKGKINALDAENGDRFGEAIGISGNTLIVGTKHHDEKGTESGAVYIFQLNEK